MATVVRRRRDAAQSRCVCSAFASLLWFIFLPQAGRSASIEAINHYKRHGLDAVEYKPAEIQATVGLPNATARVDLIADDYKIVVKMDIPPDKVNATHISILKKALAQEIGVAKDSIQVIQVVGSTVEIFVVYTVPYDDGQRRREMSILVPASKVVQNLSVGTMNRAWAGLRIAYITPKADFREDVTVRSTVTEARIWSMFEKEIWQSWQLPFLIVSCLLLLLLLVVGMVFLCFRQQIHKKAVEHETKHVCLFPVVKPVVKDTGAVQPETNAVYLTQENLEVLKRQPIRIKAKGLLERRGSTASLTIDLNPSQESLSMSTLSRDSTNEDYLLSAGNRMTRKQLRNSLKDPKLLHSEFWEIPMNHPEKVEIAGSGTKNRYRTILPNEHSRVKLEEVNDDPLSAYINANYIKGYDGEEKAYIATQGPMPHTIADFWTLLWCERVSIVVMITKLREKNKVKCEPYIPDLTGNFGDIDVSVVSVTPHDSYVIRELFLKKGNQCHKISHFWYTTWPDHKTPASPRQLLAMAVEVESRRCDSSSRPKGPVVVHCSAGIGRTGCFIATSIGMQQLLEENMVDVLGIVCSMRQDRGGMVQTAEQYEFVHRTLCLFEQSLPDQPGE